MLTDNESAMQLTFIRDVMDIVTGWGADGNLHIPKKNGNGCALTKWGAEFTMCSVNLH